MKRKADKPIDGKKPVKKRSKNALTEDEAKSRFRPDLFDPSVLADYTTAYATSTPYKHAVLTSLVSDPLLRSVRDEIRANVSFTPKETDIYKIHQSGDLANLDGLDDSSLSKLPSLLALRDALYSETFRNYVSSITGCGPLSGRKTDMAINVYTPGCYLLCHDDVIGSRKVSYILYLTDPDLPWQPSWGGALRLYPVSERVGPTGETAKTPGPDVVKTIPPAWNQLSFFAVQPGESFHDVEEVYHASSKEELEADGGRVRMAISGWFHIPQVGEEGWVEGAEAKAAAKSGLMQLQGNPDQYDRPEARPVAVDKGAVKGGEMFSAEDLEFLVKYLAPTYLTPDTLERVADHFDENFSITLPGILNARFAERLRAYVEDREKETLPEDSAEIEKGPWKVARPPHKHRFVYLQPGESGKEGKDSPVRELIEVLLPSPQFRAWLQLATKSVIESHDLVARRFRRGKDYTLATGHEGKPRLEMNIGFTPTGGWGDVDDEDEEEEDEESEAESEASTIHDGKPDTNGKGKGKGKAAGKSNGKGKEKEKSNGSPKKGTNGTDKQEEDEELEEVGGHEVYMAGDADDDEDAAVYKSSGDEDNILFFQAAAWNKMTLVLRDSGTLRFVKYVSRSAKGDRWDISGTFEIEEQDDEPDEDEVGAEAVGVLDDTEEEFKGFSSSEDSDSD